MLRTSRTETKIGECASRCHRGGRASSAAFWGTCALFDSIVAAGRCLPSESKPHSYANHGRKTRKEFRISWWLSEPNTVDSIGGNNGTAYSATSGAGAVAQAFYVNDFNCQHVRIPDNPSFRPSDAVTMEARIHPTSEKGFQLLDQVVLAAECRL